MMSPSAPIAVALGGRPAWRHLPSVGWEPRPERLVVVVPHPDDEVLGCGGLIARQARAVGDVVVVAVTDGESARGFADPELAELRRREQLAALDALGVAPEATVRAQLPDGAVAERTGELAALLSTLAKPGDLLVAPWEGDCHPDHVACGAAALVAAAGIGCEAVGMLVWAPLWGAAPDEAQCPLLRVDLTVPEQAARLTALRCHRSQLDPRFGDPIVVDELAATLAHPVELFVPIDGAGRGT